MVRRTRPFLGEPPFAPTRRLHLVHFDVRILLLTLLSQSLLDLLDNPRRRDLDLFFPRSPFQRDSAFVPASSYIYSHSRSESLETLFLLDYSFS